MEQLLANLRKVELSTLEDNPDTFLNSIDSEEYHDLIHVIIRDADSYLINDDGGCIWHNIEILKENGFDVFPGDRDQFGWLTGCIQTKKGIIVYG